MSEEPTQAESTGWNEQSIGHRMECSPDELRRLIAQNWPTVDGLRIVNCGIRDTAEAAIRLLEAARRDRDEWRRCNASNSREAIRAINETHDLKRKLAEARAEIERLRNGQDGEMGQGVLGYAPGD